jgi:hypothetical protein
MTRDEPGAGAAGRTPKGGVYRPGRARGSPFVVDGEEATSVNTGSPLIGQMAAYGFTVSGAGQFPLEAILMLLLLD